MKRITMLAVFFVMVTSSPAWANIGVGGRWSFYPYLFLFIMMVVISALSGFYGLRKFKLEIAAIIGYPVLFIGLQALTGSPSDGFGFFHLFFICILILIRSISMIVQGRKAGQAPEATTADKPRPARLVAAGVILMVFITVSLGSGVYILSDRKLTYIALSKLGVNMGSSSSAKSTLKNMATAQEYYFQEHGTYTNNLDDLKKIGLETEPGMIVKIISADANSWSASAKHEYASRGFIYTYSEGAGADIQDFKQ